MEQFKRAKVIMLPTDNKSHIYLTKVNNTLGYISGKVESDLAQFPNQTNTQNQHLYIISDDEIKEGDWMYDINGDIGQAIGKDIKEWEGNKKIIATTDTSLLNCNGVKREGESCTLNNNCKYPSCQLPQPSQQFIEKYIESYNKDEIITDVLVEYQAYVITSGYSILKEQEINDESNWLWETKVNPKDNTITIKKLKDSWNKEEIIKLLKSFEKDIENSMDSDDDGNTFNNIDSDKWIEENL